MNPSARTNSHMESASIKVVVSLSGGMDSAVCAALAVHDFGAQSVAALHVSYGQRTEERELVSFRAVCDRLGIHHRMMVKTPFFQLIGGSALTDSQIAVPEAGPAIGEHIPVTYVPFRNAHFLSAAVSWAEVLDANAVFIGAVEEDSSGYPDCRRQYYDAFTEVIRQGTRPETHIEIITPVIAMKKSE